MYKITHLDPTDNIQMHMITGNLVIEISAALVVPI